MGSIRWGILGPGTIAHQFARACQVVADAQLAAVASRSDERAQAFASAFCVPRTFSGSDAYADLAADPDIDAIYIATPHPQHLPCALACLRAGKAVLCEKPLTVNAAQAEMVIATAERSGAFLMEAMWTRFLPTMAQARTWLAEGAIGEPRLLQADFGFHTGGGAQGRHLSPLLAGGGLLDVGVYCFAFAGMVFGYEHEHLACHGRVGETAVDEWATTLIGYAGGRSACLGCAVAQDLEHRARIIGTYGSIELPDFWRGTEAILRRGDEEPQRLSFPHRANGYEYEIEEVHRCLAAGQQQSGIMPWSDTLAVLRQIDSCRQQLGVRYPANVEAIPQEDV